MTSLGEHPIRRLYDAGVPITVNSDDPPMFGTTLLDEQLLLAKKFGFTIDDIETINIQGIRSAFLPESDQHRLEAEFRDEYSRLRQELGLTSSD